MMASTAVVKKSSKKLSPRDRMMQQEIASLRSQVGRELSRFSSGLNVNLGDINEEYVPELKSIRGRSAIYERMQNDPRVGGQLRAIFMTMASGIRWKVVGGKPELRDLVAANLLRQGPRKFWCQTSWYDRLYESLGMLTYGFSLFGKTRAVVDGRVIFSDLKWLHPRSVDEDGWVMDEEDNLSQVRRSYSDPRGMPHTREPISADDLFLMTWGRRGPNWEGTSFIRPMYRPWKLGELAEKIDIIDLQNRGVGIPMAKLSGAGGIKERDTLVEILKSLRGGSKERAFIVIDKDEDVTFLASSNQAKDAQPILAYHNSGMVKAGGQEYFEQGNTATGSRAGASALATGFFVNVDGIRVILEDQINFGCGPMMGLVEELCYMNDDDVDKDELPRIEGSRVSPTEQLDNIPLVQDMVAKGVVPPVLSLANDMLRRLGWSEVSREEWDDAVEAKKSISVLGPGSPANGGPGRPNVAGPDEQGRDDKDGKRLDMQEKKTSGGNKHRRRPASYHWLQ